MRIVGRKDKGFTLAELLIVVAIIGVLVAIAIPIFTGQLEKSREAVDAANIRSQYAEVISDALLDGTSVNGKEKYGAVHLKQKKDKWLNTELATNLHSVYAQVIGTPVANGTAWVEYNDSTGQAILHYEGGTGNTAGGSTGEGSGTTGGNTTGGSGSTGGNTSGSGTGSTGTNADPNKAYENLGGQANDWPEEGTHCVVDVSTGQIIRYNGQLYVSAATDKWELTEYYYTTPAKMNYNFLAINNKPAQTIRDLKKPWPDSNQEALVKLSVGDLYLDSDNNYYIYRGGSSNNVPPSENMQDWIKLLPNK